MLQVIRNSNHSNGTINNTKVIPIRERNDTSINNINDPKNGK
jgi:hypothetical protein